MSTGKSLKKTSLPGYIHRLIYYDISEELSIIASGMYSIIQVLNKKKIYLNSQVELIAQHARESDIKIHMYIEYHNFTCRKIQHLRIMNKLSLKKPPIHA